MKTEQEILITIDIEELISLRDFDYINENDFENKEVITEALHTVISDLWKMRPLKRSKDD